VDRRHGTGAALSDSATPERQSRGPKACPSAPCIEGALLLAVLTPSGRLGYVQPPTVVDADFVSGAEALGRPESRFRFSLPCIESGCPQWSGSGCGLADMLVAGTDEEAVPAQEKLPACGIRSECRWFAQHGARACGLCPHVVADTGGTLTFSGVDVGPAAARPGARPFEPGRAPMPRAGLEPAPPD
jgi:hypothetical protein